MDDATFKLLCQSVKEGNEAAISQIFDMFEPLLYKHSIIDGAFDEDCHQELRIKLLDCIVNFRVNNSENVEKYLECNTTK